MPLSRRQLLFAVEVLVTSAFLAHLAYSFGVSSIALGSPSAVKSFCALTTPLSCTNKATTYKIMSLTAASSLRNVVIVGASYVGGMAAQELIQHLPATHRVVLVEKNSHFGHLFAYPRFAVVPSHEHKAFIPFTASYVPTPHEMVRGKVLSITAEHVLLDRSVVLGQESNFTRSIPYDAIIFATGTRLSPPGSIESEEKNDGVAYFREHQHKVKDADSIAILGGGAVGVREYIWLFGLGSFRRLIRPIVIEMATDIAELFPSKQIILIHSREFLMPRFHPLLHQTIMARFQKLGIKTILGSRAILPEKGFNKVTGLKQIVKTVNGPTIEADLVILSTGQTPLSEPLRLLSPRSILASGFVRVFPTLQVASLDDGKLIGVPKVFAIGDIADSGAPKAARPGAAQAKVVAKNILKMLSAKESKERRVTNPESSDKAFDEEDWEEYAPDPAAIHLTLGIVDSVIFRNPPSSDPSHPTASFVGEPFLKWRDDGREDMGIDSVWDRRAPGVTNHHL